MDATALRFNSRDDVAESYSCAADYAPAGATEWWKSSLGGDLLTRVDGQIVKLHRLVVHVGARFDITDRSKMVKVDLGGRTAYQAYGEHFPAPEIDYETLFAPDMS